MKKSKPKVKEKNKPIEYFDYMKIKSMNESTEVSIIKISISNIITKFDDFEKLI